MSETQNSQDTVERFHGALIQHGSFNDRIYLMKINDADPDELVSSLLEKAQTNGYTKVLAKVPRSNSNAFLNAGYRKEAEIPGFYAGKEDALFLCYYLSKNRILERNSAEIEKIYKLSKQKQVARESVITQPLDVKLTMQNMSKDDVHRMAELYSCVFPSYPFPIVDSNYLLETMESHVDYFGIETGSKLVALSSLEKDIKNKNAEMTDFATLPEWQSRGVAKHLLVHMEEQAKPKGILTAYTIARAESPGMNIVFTKNAYRYGGRLTNNTNISGHIESMNIWYKSL